MIAPRSASAALKRLGASPALSLALIVAAAAACAAGYLAPGRGLYGSRWFTAFAAACAVALACTVWLQARALTRRGLRESREGQYGSLVFHLGLLLVVASGLGQSFLQKRGFVQLMQGEIFLGREEDFLETEKGSLAGRLELPFGLRLDALRAGYWDDAQHLKELGSDLSVLRGGRAQPARAAVNSPLIDSGYAVYQSPYYGYAVSVELTRPDGRRLATHFLLDRPSKIGQAAVGGSDFPSTDYVFSLRLRPDAAGRSFALSDPNLNVEVFKSGRLAYAGPLSGTTPIKIGGDRISLADIRPWSGFDVVDRGGLWLLRLGFITTVLGAAILFALPRRRLAHAAV